jgi:sugar lactone lactonase YvrE
MKVRHLTVGTSIVLILAGALITMSTPSTASASRPSREPKATLLVAGLQGAIGSTIGPDGALYVTEGVVGRISRVDPQTGHITTFASGLPERIVGIGGAMDVAFIGKTAYVLVTLVGPDVGGSDVVGIYRVDGRDRFTVVADIGEFSIENPPSTEFAAPTGVQYALQPYRGGFLVTDGHHNRVLRVTLDGEVTELIAFDNIVPTGLAVSGNTVYMAEAGPVPHRPEDGKVVAFKPRSPTATKVASGASLLVDVEFGPRGRLYALSQGDFPPGAGEGSPAEENTGALVEVNGDGTFTVITDGLNQPTSLEFIGNTAYVVTLTGEIWKIEGVSGPPHGSPR